MSNDSPNIAADRWRRINELFEEALTLPATERAEFLVRACAGDEEARCRVSAMLEVDEKSGLLMDGTALEAVSTMLLSAESEPSYDKIFGKYRLDRELGRGGMGVVFLGYDIHLERQVALKLLPARLTDDPDRMRRFRREALAISALNHPNIITMHDYGREAGRFYIASEYVEGRTLREVIGQRDFPLDRIIDVGIQVAGAIEAAHASGIVHRDIKPENIMLRPDGYVKVLDFGLAKLTEPEADTDEADTQASGKSSSFETGAGAILGTVNYMSPEQARGQRVDGRSDLFSLGVVLYELVTGRRPFDGATRNHRLVAIMDADPTPLSDYVKGAPALLQTIVARALVKDREHRYQTAREMINDLEALQRDLIVEQRLGVMNAPEIAEDHDESAKSPSSDSSTITDLNWKHKISSEPARLSSSRQRHGWVLWTPLFIIAVAAASYFIYRNSAARPALTDKDTILLADFVNTTGDVVFDGTLKHGLEAQLAQSPYFNIFPEERARETLKLMGRSQNEKINRDVAREICQRSGIKALLTGAIASLGRNYVITLEAINSQSGEAIAHQQTEAEGKEQVIRALGRAATALRGKLGESLASIRKFDAQIEQATTPSLEALKNYSVGVELQRRGKESEAISMLKRAIELDDNFAQAHLQIGVAYRDIRNVALGDRHLQQAYQLRDRVSEREKLEISATYFRHITGELDKRIEATYQLTQTYPQAAAVHHLHGNSLLVTGQYAQAAESYATAVRLDADYVLSRSNLALSLIGMNRFDEAQAVIDGGLARNLDSGGFRNRLYLLAFIKGDAQAMRRQIEWFIGKSDEYLSQEIQARSFAFAGRRRQASELFKQAATLAEARGLIAEKARILANEANMNATFGLTTMARTQAVAVTTLLKSRNIAITELLPSTIQQLESQPPAWTLAICGDEQLAQSLAEQFAGQLAQDTLNNRLWLPLIHAAIEMNRRPGANPEKALQLLQSTRQYEAAGAFRPMWARGQAFLQSKNGALAMAEFQRIVDQRGWDVLSPLWPLAHLGQARAAAMQGDLARSREMYQKFLQLWKEADSDLPILIAAHQEYEKLR